MDRVVTALIVGVVLWVGLTNINLPKQGEYEGNSKELFGQINRYRIESGISPLEWDATLTAKAEAHSKYMAEDDNYVHSNLSFTENIMRGSNPNKVIRAWQESRLHNYNLLNPALRRGGVGMGIKVKYVQLGIIRVALYSSAHYTTYLASY